MCVWYWWWWRGATFRGFAVIIWQNAGKSLRVLSRGSRVRGPSTLGWVICKCHSGGVLCQPAGRGGGSRGGTGRRGCCSGLFSCRLFYNRCWVPLPPLSAVMALAFLMCAKHIVWHITCSVMWIPNMNEFEGIFFHWFCFFSFCHMWGHSPVGFVVVVVLYYWIYYHYLLPPLHISMCLCVWLGDFID